MSQNPNHKETAAALRGHTTAVYQHVVDQGIEEIKRLRNENDQLRLSNERMREDKYRAADLYHSLSEYAEYFGAIHADDCSQDDTCRCIYRPVNEGISCLCVMLANWKRPITLTAESGTEGKG